MKVMLIVKGERNLGYIHDVVDARLPGSREMNSEATRLGAWRIEVEIFSQADLYKVYEWFGDGNQYSAPFPDGTLLWFQVTP